MHALALQHTNHPDHGLPVHLHLHMHANAHRPPAIAPAALGSLAYGVDDGVRAIVACNGVGGIIAALCSSDERVVVAAARSLKLLYQVRLQECSLCRNDCRIEVAVTCRK
jgi:hypothetical protein